MPRPTEPVKRVCYADDITVWASRVQIPVLEQQINSYLEEMSTFLKDNSLLISAPKSTVTLFTPDPFQVRIYRKIAIADAILPLERTPKILGVLLVTSFAFHHHCEYVANRFSKRNNILKALAGTSWGQQKETLIMTYNAVGRPIADYPAPVWSTNADNTSMEKIQVAQNEALRISTGAHHHVKIMIMSSIDHLHCEAQMLKVTEHSDLLPAQYLVKCLDYENVCHNITTLDPPPRMMKQTSTLNITPPSHHCWQTLPKSCSRQSTQRLSPNPDENRESTEYYVIDHLTSAKLRRHSEDRKGQLSPSFAQVIAIC